MSTDLCGVRCENPFFLSSSVVDSNYEMVAKAFDEGRAGVAFKTIGMFTPNEVSRDLLNLIRKIQLLSVLKILNRYQPILLKKTLNFSES